MSSIPDYIVYAISLVALMTSCHQNQQREVKIGQQNAVWAESIYLRGYQPSTGEKLRQDHITTLAKILKDNNIRYVYLFAGPYLSSGRLPEYSFSQTAINSVKLIKKHYPELKILPWIGGIQNRTVFLNDTAWVENALSDTRRLVKTLDCDGIHIDLEYILNGDTYLSKFVRPQRDKDDRDYGKNVIVFHESLRKLLPGSFISTVVPSTSSKTKSWKRKCTVPELQEITKYVDQISFLFYDTGIQSQHNFESGCFELINDIKFLKTRQSNVQYLVSFGTFVNEPELHRYRDLKIENISNTIMTIKRATFDVDALNQIVDGLSIYCQWETDQSEWSEFRRASGQTYN